MEEEVEVVVWPSVSIVKTLRIMEDRSYNVIIDDDDADDDDDW